MRSRREFLTGSAALLGAAALPGAADNSRPQFKKPFQIYMVQWRGPQQIDDGFKNFLISRKISVEFIVRDAAQDPNRLKEFVAEIKDIRPDLVYTWGTSATLGIVGEHDSRTPGVFVSESPVVFTLVTDAISAKIVPFHSGHDRNITGICHVPPTSVQLDAIRAYRPFKVLGTLYNPQERNTLIRTEELRYLARRDGFKLIERQVSLDDRKRPLATGITQKLDEIKRAGADWLYLGADSFMLTQIQPIDRVDPADRLDRIGSHCIKIGLPTFATTESQMDGKSEILAGQFASYYTLGQLTGMKAEQILMKGIAARNIPVEILTEFAYVVNLATAKRLKFLPPLSLINNAEMRP